MWKPLAIAAACVGIVGFASWPTIFGCVLPPAMLLLSWLAASGPSFRRMPRHPDINAVIDSNAMRLALLRTFWTPKRVTKIWWFVLGVLALIPGVIIALWPMIAGNGTPVTLSRFVYWVMFTPLLMTASTFLLESLIQQAIAMPVTGLAIIALLYGAPLGIGLSDRPDWTMLDRFLISAMLIYCSLTGLWMVDMLRAINPHSIRNSRMQRHSVNWNQSQKSVASR